MFNLSNYLRAHVFFYIRIHTYVVFNCNNYIVFMLKKNIKKLYCFCNFFSLQVFESSRNFKVIINLSVFLSRKIFIVQCSKYLKNLNYKSINKELSFQGKKKKKTPQMLHHLHTSKISAVKFILPTCSYFPVFVNFCAFVYSFK